MSLPSGTHLGPYEIVAPIGAGGMGEVYRARDTRLDRSVAVKILPADLAHDAQLRARFEREAKAISQLNHPHICTLHDVGENFLVMELLEGETLADRIGRGPLPIEQVLRYGAEIARALDGAHRHGVVHRDLKPGNVMITRTGAKVLDFGLARSGGEIAVDVGGATVQKSLTAEGTIVGTFQYMSPEQLEGSRVDHRTDIFALGAVLYEMATGRRAFEGKTKTSLIAAIVAAEPKPIHELQPLTPASFERLVTKCLSKDPEERWQSAHDIADELTWIAESMTRDRPLAASQRSSRPWVFATAALALLLAAAATGLVLARRKPAPARMILSLTMPPDIFRFYNQAALSPGGDAVAFIGYGAEGTSAVWVRTFDNATPRALGGTEGAQMPFWSPDAKSIGFFAGGKLKRTYVAGGSPQVICDAPAVFGATWNRDNVILLSKDFDGPLVRVDANGGTPAPFTKLTAMEEAHHWPVFLPDGEHFVFLGDAARTEEHHLRLGSLKDGSSVILTQAVSNVEYAESSSSILFVRGGTLLAQTLDLEKKSLVGQPRVIAENVRGNVNQGHHFEFSVAGDRLVYRAASPGARLNILGRDGKIVQTVGEPRRYDTFRVAPDGKRIAFGDLDADGRNSDIWVLDPVRHVTTRVTFDANADFSPVWSPDGSRIAFGSTRASFSDAYVVEVANPSAVARLTTLKTGTAQPTDWSRDGSTLLIDFGKSQDADIYTYSFADRALKPYIATPFSEYGAVLSPDGSHIAYVSEESGRAEVYVERFPSHAERRQVSTDGAYDPVWSGDGRELYFRNPETYFAADLTRDDTRPQSLFNSTGPGYAAYRDGQHFLVAQPVNEMTRVPLTVATGW